MVRNQGALAPMPGYTLIELLVVLGVLSVLAVVAMPMVEVTVQREKERELKRAIWEIRDAIDAYHRVHAALPEAGGAAYPPSLVALTVLTPDTRPGRSGQVHRFLRRVPRDPFADPALPADQTWGLRSFESEASQPAPGKTVYDVYSLSKKAGLNGIPLRQW